MAFPRFFTRYASANAFAKSLRAHKLHDGTPQHKSFLPTLSQIYTIDACNSLPYSVPLRWFFDMPSILRVVATLSLVVSCLAARQGVSPSLRRRWLENPSNHALRTRSTSFSSSSSSSSSSSASWGTGGMGSSEPQTFSQRTYSASNCMNGVCSHAMNHWNSEPAKAKVPNFSALYVPGASDGAGPMASKHMEGALMRRAYRPSGHGARKALHKRAAMLTPKSRATSGALSESSEVFAEGSKSAELGHHTGESGGKRHDGPLAQAEAGVPKPEEHQPKANRQDSLAGASSGSWNEQKLKRIGKTSHESHSQSLQSQGSWRAPKEGKESEEIKKDFEETKKEFGPLKTDQKQGSWRKFTAEKLRMAPKQSKHHITTQDFNQEAAGATKSSWKKQSKQAESSQEESSAVRPVQGKQHKLSTEPPPGFERKKEPPPPGFEQKKPFGKETKSQQSGRPYVSLKNLGEE